MTGGRSRTFALLALAGLVAPLLGPQPAQAQLSSFIDDLLGRKPEAPPAAEAPAEPAPKPAAKAAKAARKPAAVKPETKGQASKGETPKGEAQAKGEAQKSEAQQVAAVGAPATATETADPATLVARANAYFNGVSTLTGNFVQVGQDGRRIGGKLTLSRPGRLRFDYDQPSSLEVIADGTSVAVRDKRLATQDLYFIAQTPLKFLLREKIDLARDLTVTGVETEPTGVRIDLEDRSTLGGTSRILLYFDPELRTLTQWRITDPQGFQTAVMLSNVQRGRPVDNMLFVINYGRAVDQQPQR